MKRILTCNYISELDSLIAEGKVDVDYVKFPAINANICWLEGAKKIKPVILHCAPPGTAFMSICSKDFIQNADMQNYKNLVEELNTPHISAHLYSEKSQYQNINTYSRTELFEDILTTTLSNISFVRKYIDLPFVLENTVFNNKPNKLSLVTDPKLIKEIIYTSNSYLLLDIAHADISSFYRNVKIEDYISQLPLDRLYEIHISGTSLVNGDMYDSHTKTNEKYYDILKFLLENTSVKFITLEYGPKDSKFGEINAQYKEELLEQLNILTGLIY